MARNRQGKRIVNLLDVTIGFFVVTGLTALVSWKIFWFMLGISVVFLIVCLAAAWDEISAWWSTRRWTR